MRFFMALFVAAALLLPACEAESSSDSLVTTTVASVATPTTVTATTTTAQAATTTRPAASTTTTSLAEPLVNTDMLITLGDLLPGDWEDEGETADDHGFALDGLCGEDYEEVFPLADVTDGFVSVGYVGSEYIVWIHERLYAFEPDAAAGIFARVSRDLSDCAEDVGEVFYEEENTTQTMDRFELPTLEQDYTAVRLQATNDESTAVTRIVVIRVDNMVIFLEEGEWLPLHVRQVVGDTQFERITRRAVQRTL